VADVWTCELGTVIGLDDEASPDMLGHWFLMVPRRILEFESRIPLK
jgi:hypothetical protein